MYVEEACAVVNPGGGVRRPLTTPGSGDRQQCRMGSCPPLLRRHDAALCVISRACRARKSRQPAALCARDVSAGTPHAFVCLTSSAWMWRVAQTSIASRSARVSGSSRAKSYAKGVHLFARRHPLFGDRWHHRYRQVAHLKNPRYRHDARGPATRGDVLSIYPMRKSMFKETVTLKFLASHPSEGIKPNNGLDPACPSLGKRRYPC